MPRSLSWTATNTSCRDGSKTEATTISIIFLLRNVRRYTFNEVLIGKKFRCNELSNWDLAGGCFPAETLLGLSLFSPIGRKTSLRIKLE